MTQDTISELETTIDSESQDTASEGVASPEIEDESSIDSTVDSEEDDIPRSHDDLFDDSAEIRKKEEALEKQKRARELSRQKIIDKAHERYLTGEISSLDDISQEWVREAVEDKIVEESSADSGSGIESELSTLKSELKALKDKTLKERSKEIFNHTLTEHGITKQEFEDRYWGKYVKKVKQLRDEGLGIVRSTELALETLGLEYHHEVVSSEKRGDLSSALSMPKDTGKRIDSNFNRREFDEYNRSLEALGVSPLSKSAYLAGKNAGTL